MRHHQVRKVGADDEQQESDSGLQHPDRSAGIAHDRVPQRLQLQCVICRDRGMLDRDVAVYTDALAPVIEQCGQLRVCRLRRDARFESRNDIKKMGATLRGGSRMNPER